MTTDNRTNDDREALASVEAELAEWLSGKRSWCDQHHGLPNEIELTAKADEAQIRLLMTRRDALRTEVQGEPSDEEVDRARDVIDRTFGWKHLRKYGPRSEEWMDQLRDGLVRGVLGGARASVPDAATEELKDIAETHAFCADRLFIETELVDEIRAERDAATAAIAEVRALHRREPGTGVDWCSHCIDNDGPWPCATIAALDGAPEPEENP